MKRVAICLALAGLICVAIAGVGHAQYSGTICGGYYYVCNHVCYPIGDQEQHWETDTKKFQLGQCYGSAGTCIPAYYLCTGTSFYTSGPACSSSVVGTPTSTSYNILGCP